MSYRLRGDKIKFRAAEVNRWNKLADQQQRGELNKPIAPTLKTYDPSSRIALCKNTSGSDRTALDCMSISGLLWDLEADGSADIVFELDTADPDLAPAILLDPIANNGFGRAVLDGLAIAKITTSASTGYRFGSPNAAGHAIEAAESGSIKLLSAPSASAATYLPVVLNAGAGAAAIAYLFTLTGTVTAGVGAATIRNMADDTEIETGASVLDPLGHFAGLTSGYRGVCLSQGGNYYAIGPYVTSVRWNDPDLEYSRNGGGAYLPIDTAEEC